MATVNLMTQTGFAQLLQAAAQSPRQRQNLNFHTSDDAACHRLLIALQPETYVQPHCHFAADKEETLVMLQGKVGLVIFNADGSVASTDLLSAGGESVGVNIPPRVFHALVVLEPAVFFEAKAGPYVPVAAAERAPWAPAEGQPECEAYRKWMRSLF